MNICGHLRCAITVTISAALSEVIPDTGVFREPKILFKEIGNNLSVVYFKFNTKFTTSYIHVFIIDFLVAYMYSLPYLLYAPTFTIRSAIEIAVSIVEK